MSRSVVLLLLAAVLVLPAFNTAAGSPQSDCPTLSLETTFLCVALTFGFPSAQKHEYVIVDWGDGSSEFLDCVGGGRPCSMTAPHTYATAGTYAIQVTALTYCPGSINLIQALVSSAPTFPLHIEASENTWIQPATSEALDVDHLLTSTIDWGDGSPVQVFEWVDNGTGVLLAPQHEYAGPGEYHVVTSVEYAGAWGGSCYERVGTLDAVVGPATQAETATWGRVKALYR